MNKTNKMSKRIKDLTGQIFGYLEVVEFTGRLDPNNRGAIWKCRCLKDGNFKDADSNSLKKGLITSCGCKQSEHAKAVGAARALDLTGKTFGRLTVLYQLEERTNDGGIQWWCRCSCENHTELPVKGTLLAQGKTKSCGCIQREKAAKHGHSLYRDYTGKTINGIYIKEMVPRGSKDTVTYCVAVCPKCQKEWKVAIGDLKRKDRAPEQCGECAASIVKQSKTEKAFFQELQQQISFNVHRFSCRRLSASADRGMRAFFFVNEICVVQIFERYL